MIYLDTHVVVWLYAGQIELISKTAVEYIENNDLYISPIVYLELKFLYETSRIIVAHAIANDAVLVTKDTKILANYLKARW